MAVRNRGAARRYARAFILLLRSPPGSLFVLVRFLFGDRTGLYAVPDPQSGPRARLDHRHLRLPPDGRCFRLSWLCLLLARVLFVPNASPMWWLAAGACGGVACLSKLHGVFLFAGAGLFLLTVPSQRRWLLTPWPYLGAAIAALMFLPVIVWNAQHDWVSFAFQGGRARVTRIDLLGPLRTLAGHALFILPWLWVPLVASLVRQLIEGPRGERGWLVACLAIGPIAVFTLVALSGNRVLYHWAAPGYMFAFALLGRDLAQILAGPARWTRVWLASTAASLVLILGGTVALAGMRWPAGGWASRLPYPLIETVSWGGLKQELSGRGLLAQPNLFVAATHWHEAARIDIALGGRLPVRCLCSDARGYGVIYRNADHAGQDALIVAQNNSERDRRTLGSASKGSAAVARGHSAGRATVLELQLYLGRRFSPQGNAPACVQFSR